VFLAFEEALNNALKHSQATRVQVSMRLLNGSFEVRIQDNGKGFTVTPAALPGQDGLLNIRERLRVVSGQCELVSGPGAGATVSLRFPLPGLVDLARASDNEK